MLLKELAACNVFNSNQDVVQWSYGWCKDRPASISIILFYSLDLR
jgi:hypothetical protein